MTRVSTARFGDEAVAFASSEQGKQPRGALTARVVSSGVARRGDAARKVQQT